MKLAIERPTQFVRVPERRPPLMVVRARPLPPPRPSPPHPTWPVARVLRFSPPARPPVKPTPTPLKMPLTYTPTAVLRRFREQPVTPPQVEPLTTSDGATEIGVLGTGAGGTSVSMTTADLRIGPRTDITHFAVTIDAGRY